VKDILERLRRPAYVLDEGVRRRGLDSEPGRAAAEHAEDIRRGVHVASILAESAIVPIVWLGSADPADWALAKKMARERGPRLIEVRLDAASEEGDPN
jgi:adenylylsulfate kinase-like enzyme